MPDFKIYGVETEVDIDIDISVDEFLTDCCLDEIEEVIDWLEDYGYLNEYHTPDSSDNLLDITYKEALDKLYTKRVNLTSAEEQFIINLANRF